MSVLYQKFLQGIRNWQDDANPYSPVASLALLLIVGVVVKSVH
jgi:hypothetical protein